MTLFHIHAPKPSAKRISSGNCPDCKRHTWFIGVWTEWYGWDVTCLRCGREWADGQWMPLPFMRGARQRNIDNAKRRFRNTAVSEEITP